MREYLICALISDKDSGEESIEQAGILTGFDYPGKLRLSVGF
jgi:hypothetical protein